MKEMTTTKRAFDLSRDFKATGNFAVDMVASCIIFHRRRHVALKSIDLKPAAYELFRRYAQDNLGKDYNPEQGLMFDKVNINLGSIFQKSDILPQLFETN